MAKKKASKPKKTKTKAVVEQAVFDAEIEDAAYLLTILLHTVNPIIDKGQSFELAYELLVQGMTEDDAIMYGNLIRDTALNGGSPTEH